MGFEMLGAIAIPGYIGLKLDEYFQNSTKGYTLGFMLFGVMASMYLLIRKLNK